MNVTYVLAISILLQFTAAFLALRLIPITKQKRAWLLISLAIVLMAVRRCITLLHLISDNQTFTIPLNPEFVALAVSLLMVFGIASIAPLFYTAKATEQTLRKSREQFRSFFNHGGAGMYTYNLHGVILQANPSFCQMLGYSEAELLGMSIIEITIPAEREDVYRRLEKAIDKKVKPCNFEKSYLCKDGSVLIGYFTGKWVFDDPNPCYAVAMVQDITEQKQSEQRLKEERTFLQAVIDGVTDPILFIAPDHRVLLANSAAQVIAPTKPLSSNKLYCHEFWHQSTSPCQGVDSPCPLQEIRKTGKPTKVIHHHMIGANEKRIYELKASPLFNTDGTLKGVIETSRDLTDILKSKAQINEQAKSLNHISTHDNLTQLPNRELFMDRLRHAIKKTSRLNSQTALIHLDLDRFKNINDSLGHELGDLVLIEISERLRNTLRETDTLARLGGDEFHIILENIENIEDISMVCRNLLNALSAPIKIADNELFATASIGISLAPNDSKNVTELIKYAEVAMYRIKDISGNNYQFYTPDMNARTHELLLLEGCLRKSIDENQLVLHYQPQIDLTSGILIGSEALVRWQHPDMGMISPADFIPLAEKTGLIVTIGEWVLRSACVQNKDWQEAGQPPIRVAVNISSRQFREPGFFEMVERVIDETGLDPEWLELEITESLIMENVDEAITILNKLKDRGIHLAIDDFGTGYSSLSYLKRFPLTHLKIDQSFVRDITTDENDAAITVSIIALARSMGLKVIAEGVETEGQLHFLKQNNCEQGQGYLFSRPIPANEFNELFNSAKGLIY